MYASVLFQYIHLTVKKKVINETLQYFTLTRNHSGVVVTIGVKHAKREAKKGVPNVACRF